MKTGIKLTDGWTKSSHSGHAGACVIARIKHNQWQFGDSKYGRLYNGPTPILTADAALINSIKNGL
ncbi:DUF397 domain-containing protein [Stackebrandtia nassauensis]|uniref:Uncharacterized protein n=1 Tax=Stackebrandtia nassauensis (strain DSM 44728 / CIP 108903 / NRRL B-16338 / NBRC 102104 / LLR-40K-21) TaxID=446470 RepID=D3Q0P7_STANL|nr:DUF397 domain-containing protein [Stackebrandtia nassauensis]ADD41783.1 hypothetical protein Snas_2089 [Stackebrandtia nassauensis DSM 44728]